MINVLNSGPTFNLNFAVKLPELISLAYPVEHPDYERAVAEHNAFHQILRMNLDIYTGIHYQKPLAEVNQQIQSGEISSDAYVASARIILAVVEKKLRDAGHPTFRQMVARMFDLETTESQGSTLNLVTA